MVLLANNEADRVVTRIGTSYWLGCCVVGAAHVARYAQLVEGGVYQLGQRRDDLLEPRLTLACATQIPQTSLRRQVYGAAEWASLTPLAYELPKRWAYMSRDAVSVGECVDQADVGGVVALHGRVVERRHLEPLAGEGAAAACAAAAAAAAAAAPTPADATGLWLGLPANKKVPTYDSLETVARKRRKR